MEFKKRKITIIGAGRLAYSLVYHLQTNGFIVSQVMSRSKQSAEKLSRKFKIPVYKKFDGELQQDSEVIFLTIPDHNIEAAGKLISMKNKHLDGKVFVHFSGSFNSSLLNSLKKKKALTASLHIMQTFPSDKIVNIKNCYAAVETADDTLLISLFNFAKLLKLKPFRISSESKLLYHMTGVFSSNFLVSHYYNSERVFANSKIDTFSYNQIFNKIIKQTEVNIRKKGLSHSLSGPAVRGDLNTIKNHIELLKKKKEYLLVVNYVNESLTILNILSEGGLSIKEHYALKKYLRKELKDIIKVV